MLQQMLKIGRKLAASQDEVTIVTPATYRHKNTHLSHLLLNDIDVKQHTIRAQILTKHKYIFIVV